MKRLVIASGFLAVHPASLPVRDYKLAPPVETA
jgi:hypothetical protein